MSIVDSDSDEIEPLAGEPRRPARSREPVHLVARIKQDGMRLDQYLHMHLADYSRSELQRAIESGKTIGALSAWVETSNLNHPGILAYQRLGFALCGFDLTLYQGTPSEGEFAIYLARPIAE